MIHLVNAKALKGSLLQMSWCLPVPMSECLHVRGLSAFCPPLAAMSRRWHGGDSPAYSGTRRCLGGPRPRPRTLLSQGDLKSTQSRLSCLGRHVTRLDQWEGRTAGAACWMDGGDPPSVAARNPGESQCLRAGWHFSGEQGGRAEVITAASQSQGWGQHPQLTYISGHCCSQEAAEFSCQP